jgi:hypothetical protein
MDNEFIKTTKKPIFFKVLWFVDVADEENIKLKIGNRSNFIFAKTLNEFEEQINPNLFLVYSVEKNNDSDNLLKIIRSHPDCIFHELFDVGKVKITESHALSRLETNIKQGMWLDDIINEINNKQT